MYLKHRETITDDISRQQRGVEPSNRLTVYVARIRTCPLLEGGGGGGGDSLERETPARKVLRNRTLCLTLAQIIDRHRLPHDLRRHSESASDSPKAL